MKKTILFCTILGGLCLGGCFNEDDIHVDLEYNRRTYDTTSSDPVMNYISKYYYKYDKEIILDPDTADYVYNFQYKNDLNMIALKKERWQKSLDVVKELFLNGHSFKTIKEYFPYNLIIADTIKYYGGVSPRIVDAHCSTNFISFAINEKKLTLTEDEKLNLSLQMQTMYLNSYCVQFGKLQIPKVFDAVSGAYYESTTAKFPTLEKAYAVGFTQIVKEGSWYTCPTKQEDLGQWITFMLTIPEDDLTHILATYDAMKRKYEGLSAALTQMGIDCKKIVYKKK